MSRRKTGEGGGRALRAALGALPLLAAACAPSDDLSAPGAPGEAPVHVVFDQSLDQLSSPFDTGFEGMSRLAAMLRRHGATVSVNNWPLEAFLPGIRGPGNVLVLGIPWRKRYTDQGREAIGAFLDSGGGVLVISEHDDFYEHTEVQNALTAPLGIRTLPTRAGERPLEGDGPGRSWPVCRVERWGLEKVRLYLPAPLRVEASAEVLAEVASPEDPGLSAVAALSRRRGGPLVVLADLEVLWNMSPTTGVRAGENAAFLLRLFGLLGGRDGPLEARRPEPRIDAWQEGERLALFESTGMGWFPDGAPNGLSALAERLHRRGFRIGVGGGPERAYEEVDLLIVAVPLERLAAPQRLREARRILLVGDGRSSLLKAEPRLAALFAENFDFDEREYADPLNAAAAPHGFQFLAVTLLAPETAGMVAAARWEKGGRSSALYRSGVIALTEPAEAPVTVRAYAAPGFWPGVNLIPMVPEGIGGVTPERRPLLVVEEGRPVLRKLPVIVETPRAMGVADLELVADQQLEEAWGAPMLDALSAWLDSDPEG